MYQRNDLREGMMVRSIDGEKLGKVFAVQEGEFLIEKGLFFPKDYVCRFSEISDIRNDEIILMYGKEGLHRFSLGEDQDVLAGTSGTAGAGPGTVGIPVERRTGLGMGADTAGAKPGTVGVPAERRTSQSMGADTAGQTASASKAGVERLVAGKDEVVVPVYKEELDVTKRERQAGEVRVHKDVVEEEKVLKVPVKRERVRVERREVKDRPAVSASFQEETVVVPLRAEEVEVHKRSVVDEEVVIRKDVIEEEQRVVERVRHEEVAIRGEEDVESSRKMNLPPDDPSLRRS